MGALSQYKQNGAESDPDAMYRALVLYWTAVRDTFPDACGKPPSQRRLMHSAGIPAIAALLDPVMLRADCSPTPLQPFRHSLLRLAPPSFCPPFFWSSLVFPFPHFVTLFFSAFFFLFFFF